MGNNQFNSLFDGLFKGLNNLAEGIEKKRYRDDAEKRFGDYQKKLIEGYGQLLNKGNALDNANNKLTPSVVNNGLETGIGLQMPMGQEPKKEFNPIDIYTGLIDFQNSIVDNPFGKEYSKNAHDLFSLMFRQHAPKFINGMNYDDAKSLSRRHLYNNLMNLNDDVRTQVLRNDDFARKIYRKKTGVNWIDKTDGGGLE